MQPPAHGVGRACHVGLKEFSGNVKVLSAGRALTVESSLASSDGLAAPCGWPAVRVRARARARVRVRVRVRVGVRVRVRVRVKG